MTARPLRYARVQCAQVPEDMHSTPGAVTSVSASATDGTGASSRAELPTGFRVFFLPFAEDVRKYELNIPEEMRGMRCGQCAPPLFSSSRSA